MSFNVTIDDIVYQKNTQAPNMADKPFIKKEWTNKINDTNTSSNYTSNQVIFDSTSLTGSGSLPNYQEGLIMLPFSVKITAGNADWTANNLPYTDYILGIKNSNVSFVNSVSVNVNNIDIIQGVPLTNAYLNFIQHSEMSLDDEFLNSPLTGYSKDNSTSWYFNTPVNPDGTNLTANSSILRGDTRGCGLGNNCNFGLVNGFTTNDTYNEGLLKRQKLFTRKNNEKTAVHGDFTLEGKGMGKSFIQNTAVAKYMYYHCYLRLKDLVPNFFNNLPLSYGLKIKITLTLNNNVSFEFSKDDTGNFVYDFSKFSNPTSNTNPLMIAASYNTLTSQTGTKFIPVGSADAVAENEASNAGSYGFKKTISAVNDSLVPCGSSTIPCATATVYKVQLKLGAFPNHSIPVTQCELYVPSYKFNEKYEQEYLSASNRKKRFYYTELEYQSFEVRPTSTFNPQLSSSCVRPKRLIIIPIIHRDSNFGLNPVSSPFTTEPSTTSPIALTSFNCRIGNDNIFPNDISYSYDYFIQQLNGSTGVNANIMNGLVSSRINLVDWGNNYNYIVCDLSRRSPGSDETAVSIGIKGTLVSPLTVEFHCFIEREKWLEIDVITGEITDKG
jgi:hypothetical protein